MYTIEIRYPSGTIYAFQYETLEEADLAMGRINRDIKFVKCQKRILNHEMV